MKNKYDLANVQARAIEQIVDIITTPGEEISDGECIDSIWAILKHDLEIDVDAILKRATLNVFVTQLTPSVISITLDGPF